MAQIIRTKKELNTEKDLILKINGNITDRAKDHPITLDELDSLAEDDFRTEYTKEAWEEKIRRGMEQVDRGEYRPFPKEERDKLWEE